MGLSLCKIGDVGSGTCYDHKTPINTTGIIVTGSGNVFCNGQGVATIGDIVLSSCGHVGIIITGSGSVFCNGKGVARIGDSFDGSFKGVLITGSGSVFAG